MCLGKGAYLIAAMFLGTSESVTLPIPGSSEDGPPRRTGRRPRGLPGLSGEVDYSPLGRAVADRSRLAFGAT